VWQANQRPTNRECNPRVHCRESSHTVSATFSIDERRLAKPPGRGSDPLRPGRSTAGVAGRTGPRTEGEAARRGTTTTATPAPVLSAAAGRQLEQLPAFAPLLEEVELDGWSSHERMLSGNFHDWMLLDGGRVLVMAGQVVGRGLCDPIETALIAQAAWTAVRAHSLHTDDAGQILSLAARTLWTNPAMCQQANVAVALVDSIGGSASLAIAGACLAWRVRAATWEQFPADEPPLGAETHFAYTAHEFALSLRERLLLVADHPAHRPAKFAPTIAADFTRLSAESHRRMTAAAALNIVRRQYESETAGDVLASASVVAVRRR